MPMIKIIEGEFFMGSDDPIHYKNEKPLMTMQLDTFFIDKYEVSNQQFNQCIQAKQCNTPIKQANPDHPVQNINWQDAQSYCKYVGGSLPSEAQWEYAARGNLSMTFPWGNSLIDPESKTLITDNLQVIQSEASLISVTTTSKPNTDSIFGVSHLAGNISEWTLDNALLDQKMMLAPRKFSKKELKKRRSKNYLSQEKSIYKIVKGASYLTAFPLFQRSSYRAFYPMEKSSKEVGFRCATPLQ